MAAGHQIRVDTGASVGVGTVQTVGTAAATAPTTWPPRRRSATRTSRSTSVTGMTAGHQIRVDTGANLEVATIQTVGTRRRRGHRHHADGAAHARARERCGGAGSRQRRHARRSARRWRMPSARRRRISAPASPSRPRSRSARARRAADPARRPARLRLVERGAARRLARVAAAAAATRSTLTNTTSYPIDQSMGASWDPDLMYRVASADRPTSRARSCAATSSNLDFYSPTMNLQRDPRWGRNDESYGEDPYSRRRWSRSSSTAWRART